MVRGLRAPPRLGVRAAARAGPVRRDRAIEQARAAGARVSIDLSSWSAIRDFGADRFRSQLEELAPDVVFANEDEDEIVGGPIAGSTGSSSAAPRGASFDGVERAAVAVESVVDSTGAGDAFAAGWLVGGPDLALAAGARCVQLAGSMPGERDHARLAG